MVCAIFSRQCYNITGLIYLVVCWPKLSLNYSIVYSLTIVGRLYYTVWPKSAVGNADCSFKNIFIVSFIIIFGTLSFPTADFDQTV